MNDDHYPHEVSEGRKREGGNDPLEKRSDGRIAKSQIGEPLPSSGYAVSHSSTQRLNQS